MDFNPHNDIPDLSGKVVLVTGGNRGLGAATIKYLVPHNPSTIYLCVTPASLSTAEELVSSINSTCPGVNLDILLLDLSSFASIKQCADDFEKKADRLDMLFLNAGISTTAPALTKDGYESQFGINYMGHALLTQLLMPKLLQAASSGRPGGARIMVTTSMAARMNPPQGGLALSQMKSADPLSSPYQRYAHSKVAKILFARKLSQVYPSVLSVAFDPGQVYTDLFSKATGINSIIRRFILPTFAWLTGVSAEKGSENGLWAATASGVINGAYYEPVGKLMEGNKYFTDQKLADELWDWTEQELEEHGASGWLAG